MSAFVLLPQDRDVIDLYKDFLPERVFDAHVHLHAEGTAPGVQGKGAFWRQEAGLTDYFDDVTPFFPKVRSMGVNAMPMPDPAMNAGKGLREKANEHISQCVADQKGNVGSVYIMRGDSAEKIEAMAALPQIRALKCYSYSSGMKELEACTVDSFLPEAAWELAEARQLPIILHMMRPRALSDPQNLQYIQAMTKKYPHAPLILAHCARGFASWTAVEGIRKLGQIENVWFDLASVCEPSPIMACIQYAPERTLWGTDYPICMNRGRAISLGTGQFWLISEALPKSAAPTTVLAESLLALYQSALLLGLDQTQVGRLFYGNAANLFGL